MPNNEKTAAERALDLVSRREPLMNFVDFTTTLVREVFHTLVESTREQLETYTEMVAAISGGPDQFLLQTIGDVNQAALKYLNEVIRPTYTTAASNFELDSDGKSIKNPGDDVTLVATQSKALQDTFVGVDANNDGKPDALVVTTSGSSQTVKLSDLYAHVRGFLLKAGRRSYDELSALLKMGLMRVVPKQGFIETSLTFKVDSTDASGSTSDDSDTTATTHTDSYSSNLTRGGSLSGAFKNIIGGSFSAKLDRKSSSFNAERHVKVKTVDETSSSTLTTHTEMLGRVRIDFLTDYFPLMPPDTTPAPVPAPAPAPA